MALHIHTIRAHTRSLMGLYVLHVYIVGFNHSFKVVSAGSLTHEFYISSLYIMHARRPAVRSR